MLFQFQDYGVLNEMDDVMIGDEEFGRSQSSNYFMALETLMKTQEN
jgi:hypothetical protein